MSLKIITLIMNDKSVSLTEIKCVPCQGGEPPLVGEELKEYESSLPDWEVYDNATKIKREFEFPNFRLAIEFVDRVASLAEEEGHHPNIYVYDFKKVRIELWTHKINGLHQNDFVMAAKINELN